MEEVQILAGCEARRYKVSIARKSWRNYLKIFSIILHSQGFTQKVICFLFRTVFSLFGIIAMTIAAAGSSLLTLLSVEIEIKELK